MKLNLPMTLSSPKISSLLLLTLLNLPASEAGERFKNCLDKKGVGSSYNLLLNHSFDMTNKQSLNLCCNSSSCYNKNCLASDSDFACQIFNNKDVFCRRIGFGTPCQGIVGDNLIIDNYTDSTAHYICQGISNTVSARKYLSSVTPEGLEDKYAVQQCINPADNGCLNTCSWDNGGWICSQVIPGGGFCYLQFQAPSFPTAIPTTTCDLSEDNRLVEKIAIPVGSVIGNGLITGLTYYYCKKKKKKNNLAIQEVEDNNHQPNDEVIELTDRETTPVIRDIEIQEVNEENNELVTLTPPITPQPNQSLSPQTLNSSLSAKEILINELKDKLTGQEQLWNDYCEADQLLASNPNSKIISDSFNNYQNQLLQFLTVGEISLLLENYSQTEYTQAIEVAREIRYSNPQH